MMIWQPKKPHLILPGDEGYQPPSNCCLMGHRMMMAAGRAGEIIFAGKAGDSTNLTTYSITVACGDGGDVIVGVFGSTSGQTINSWSIGGQTITTKETVINSGNATVALGTASNVGSGNQTFAITWSGEQIRTMVFVWQSNNYNIVTMADTDTVVVDGWAMILNVPGGGAVVAMVGHSSGFAFTGSSGVTFDGNQSNEANAGGGSISFIAADATFNLGFTAAGASTNPAGCAVALTSS